MTCVYIDINSFAYALLVSINRTEDEDELINLSNIYANNIFPPDWDEILFYAIQEKRSSIFESWFMHNLRKAGL